MTEASASASTVIDGISINCFKYNAQTLIFKTVGHTTELRNERGMVSENDLEREKTTRN